MNVMDNQATKYIKKILTKKECKLQVVEPHNHHVNAAERAIQTFKDAYIATLAKIDRDFPLQLWDKLHRKSKTHSTYSRHRASTQIYLHTKLSTGLTIGIGNPLPHLVAKQSYTKHRRCADHGHCKEQMYSIWGLWRTTIDAICTSYRRCVLIES